MEETQVIAESKQINLIADSSTMNAFEKCPMLMKYQYIDNLRPKGAKSVALEKGDLLHVGLKHYYIGKRDKLDWEDCTRKAVTVMKKVTERLSLDQKTIEEVLSTFLNYAEFYRFEQWQIIDAERPFRVVLFEDDDLRIIIQGRIDLIVDTGQLILPVDHKSESRRSEAIPLSNQFMCYSYAAKANNLLVNKIGFQSSLKAAEKFYRVLLSYEDDNLQEWREEFIYKVRELVNYAQTNWFPHRYSSCQDKYGKCMFHSVCHTHRAARQIRLNSQFEVSEPWSPFNEIEGE